MCRLVLCLLLASACLGDCFAADDYRLTVNSVLEANKGWELYKAGKFSGEYNGGKYTDANPATPVKNFWSNGIYAKYDRDSNGHCETIFVIANGRLFYVGSIDMNNTFIDTSNHYRVLTGKPVTAFEKHCAQQAGSASHVSNPIASSAEQTTLRILAFVNGRAQNAYVTIRNAANNAIVARDYLTKVKGKFSLRPRSYNVEIRNMDIAGKPVLMLENVSLQPGQITTERVKFPVGSLIVSSYNGNEAFNGYITIYKNNKMIAGDFVKNQPNGFLLSPGMYTVELTRNGVGKKVILKDIVILNKQTLRRNMDLNSSVSVVTDPTHTLINQLETSAAAGSTLQEDGEKIAQKAGAHGTGLLNDAAAKINKLGIIHSNVAPNQPDSSSVGASGTVGSQNVGAVGAPASTVDYSKVGATAPQQEPVETQEQGNNPFAGMTPEEAQAAFAAKMGLQKPNNNLLKTSDFRLGNDYPIHAKAYIKKLEAVLRKMAGEIQGKGNIADIQSRIDTAKQNLIYLNKMLRDDESRDALQRTIYTRVQELNSIRMSIDMLN